MNILITGSHGFMGSHVYAHLLNRSQFRVIAPNSKLFNILDEKYVKYILDSKIDTIIHLAGISKPALKEDSWTSLVKTNVQGTENLLHYCKKGCRFILASSIVVYGNTPEPAQETDLPNPTSIYGASKLAAESLVSAYTNMGRINGICLRLCATVGSGLTHGVVHDFIEKARNNDKEFPIMGNAPGSVKPYLHIDDVITAISKAIIMRDINGCFNICPEDNLSIQKIAEITLSKCDKPKLVRWTGENFAGDNPILHAKNTKARNILEWQPAYKSESAIRKALNENQFFGK